MRVGASVLAVMVLAACEPRVPDSAAGVGFDSYEDYSARRERALREAVALREVTDIPPVTMVELGADPGTGAGAAPSAAAEPAGAPLSAMRPDAMPAPSAGRTGLSDEQSFEAVSARESIESDRERLQRQRQGYQVIAPEPLPERREASEPNIVQYALRSTNRVGEQRYRRTNPFRESQFRSNCARYPSSDLAQQAFLAAGGPERDRLNIDPDGDGFACSWDPAPFRRAVR